VEMDWLRVVEHSHGVHGSWMLLRLQGLLMVGPGVE
jgi:hypothetical protein